MEHAGRQRHPHGLLKCSRAFSRACSSPRRTPTRNIVNSGSTRCRSTSSRRTTSTARFRWSSPG
jgi:hypothetical protein